MKQLLLPALLLLTLVACRKEEDKPRMDSDYSAAVDNDRAEVFFSDALKQSDAVMKDGTVFKDE